MKNLFGDGEYLVGEVFTAAVHSRLLVRGERLWTRGRWDGVVHGDGGIDVSQFVARIVASGRRRPHIHSTHWHCDEGSGGGESVAFEPGAGALRQSGRL